MTDKRRVLLVGAGGIGAIAALNLERGGLAKVAAVLRSNFDVVNRKGFSIRSCDHGNLENWRPSQVLNAVPAVSDPSPAGRYDYVVCCTKNTPDAGPNLPDIVAPAVSPGHTVIVLIQNGLNIQRPFFRRFPSNVVLSGVSRIDAHELSPGVVEQKQHDLLHVGAFRGPGLDDDDDAEEQRREAARRFVEMYAAAGAATCLHRPDVDLDRWSKLVYNASFNPVCALTGLNASELQVTGRAMDSMVVPAMREVLAVATAAGHEIPEDVIDKTISLNPVEDNIKPSMQVDFEKASPTLGNLIEHENILGEVVREAQKHGVATPILSVMYEICCAHQWRFKKARGLV
ncbi:ApbA-domain-containing protein [Colletotrichum falcatum]|nr:ApbA-domain-containing protein [Colletotrichum falcatum]